MAYFIRLTSAHTDKEVIVNVDTMRYFQSFGDGVTLLHFDKEDSLPVKETVADVNYALKNDMSNF
jgi:hypothetical protein